jgi:UDP-4-amino-4,6-dideoxy-N-acetyl-beta-L-altrosamine N-acetyltransferase
MTSKCEQKIWLRAMKEADLHLVLGWRNHPDVRQHMFTQNEVSLADHRLWFKSVSADSGRVLLILEVDAVPCGYVNFRCNEPRQAVWGFYLAPNSPKGTGKLLGQAATEYGFSVLGLEIIRGEVMHDNAASQNFHLRQGFVLESILPKKSAGQQKVGNVRIYLLTKGSWQARQGRTE